MATTAPKIRIARQTSGATAYVALIALAVLQLGLALHHNHHSATELSSTCTACVQLEQFDDVVTATEIVFAVEADDAVAQTLLATGPAARPLRPYFGRAPPARA